MNRTKIIIRTSVYGIIVNLMLVGFKMAVGIIAGSISIVLDAVNNLTDMLSSVMTIVGAKIASRAPDRDHPYGHGRAEYLSTLGVGLVVLAAGATALFEAVPKIFHPEVADYSLVTVIIVAIAVVVKLVFGQYVKKTGEKVNSGSLKASGVDAMMDALLSFGTLVGVAVSLIWHVSIDGIIGSIIALFIIKASFEMLKDGWINIIGRRADTDLTSKIKEEINQFPQVSGAYDLILHNYGPDETIGSVHIEVPDALTAREIHHLTREIAADIYVKFKVILTIGIYAENVSSPSGRKIRDKLNQVVAKTPEILQVHGFYVDEKIKLVSFDLVMDFAAPDKTAIKNKITRTLKKQFPNYRFMVVLDADVSD